MLLHVVVAALLRTVMRRAGVGPWVATNRGRARSSSSARARRTSCPPSRSRSPARSRSDSRSCCSPIHEGPLDRRDWFGLGAGVARTDVLGCGRRDGRDGRRGDVHAPRPRVAAFHTVPLVAIYLAWYLRYGRSATKVVGSMGGVVAFVRTDLAATFGAFGGVAGAGFVLAVLLGVGLTLLWQASGPAARRSRLAIPAALSAGTIVFYVTAAVGPEERSAVVVLPEGVALPLRRRGAVDSGARHRVRHDRAPVARARSRRARLPRCRCTGKHRAPRPTLRAHKRSGPETPGRSWPSIAGVPLSARAPGSLRPDPVGAPSVTLDWLRNALQSNDLPAVKHPSATLLATDRLRLSLMELDSVRTGHCATLTAPVVRNLARGASVDIGDGVVAVTSLPTAGPPDSRDVRQRVVPVELERALAQIGDGPPHRSHRARRRARRRTPADPRLRRRYLIA